MTDPVPAKQTTPKRRPYVAPRLVTVQTRREGDQLSPGCKSPAGGGVGVGDCQFKVTPCSTNGS